ncbi:MAG: hypothetical protein P4M15_07275 [Alphaproteobacteria bacterium]|nr:hypothetical protein [Alphaproteobacteria bacterium]
MSEGKRPAIDWERIESEYRAGQLSIREIARTYQVDEKAVRTRAAKCGWTRALADKVRERVKEKLVRSESPHPLRASDADIVEAASLRGLAVVTSHRKDLAQLHALKRIILDRLAAHLNSEPIEGPFMGDKETPGDLVEKLSRVTSRLIPLERQAHNLDDTMPGASGASEVDAARRRIMEGLSKMAGEEEA